jgi:hypothetical protein
MADVNATLAANRDAIDHLIAAAEKCGAAFAVPRAPGKWSPSQLVEHVARTLDESANLVSGAATKFPTLPFFLRPVLRGFLFNRVLKKGTFPKAKTNKALNPANGPATAADARIRLETALARFDRECRTCADAGGAVASATFGTLRVEDYARFIELHTRHHCKQMPGAS